MAFWKRQKPRDEKISVYQKLAGREAEGASGTQGIVGGCTLLPDIAMDTGVVYSPKP